MKRIAIALGLLVMGLAVVVGGVLRGPAPERATASSHREAPGLSEDWLGLNAIAYRCSVGPDLPGGAV